MPTCKGVGALIAYMQTMVTCTHEEHEVWTVGVRRHEEGLQELKMRVSRACASISTHKGIMSSKKTFVSRGKEHWRSDPAAVSISWSKLSKAKLW